MNKMIKLTGLAVLAALTATEIAGASPITYRPINPSFGGDPLNGNWLLAYGQAQASGSSDSPGFSIDFPEFGDIGQPDPDLEELPDTGDDD
jgi:curli production assembly/transport component CsgF